jgi:hypothetical protein
MPSNFDDSWTGPSPSGFTATLTWGVDDDYQFQVLDTSSGVTYDWNLVYFYQCNPLLTLWRAPADWPLPILRDAFCGEVLP